MGSIGEIYAEHKLVSAPHMEWNNKCHTKAKLAERLDEYLWTVVWGEHIRYEIWGLHISPATSNSLEGFGGELPVITT